MRLPWDSIQSNATAFSKRWKDAKSEEAQAQSFLTDFLRAFSIGDPEYIGDFEYKVDLASGRKGYIDYFWKSKIAIEMKSRGENLDHAYHQLQTYMQSLPQDEIPDLWLISDFENMRLYRRSAKQIHSFKTKDLRKNIKLFADIAGYETERVIEDKIQVNVKAAEKMAKLHNGLKAFGYEGHNLEVYLVRLLFCMFADDTGIFKKDSFYHYIGQSKEDGSDLSFRIFNLFDILNTDEATRTKRPHLAEMYNLFRYINGALFETPLPPADFDSKMRGILLDCINFDWAEISPAIFGAMFQGVMDEKQRREMGAHYTSEENIIKLINPLFMDELWAEFDRVKTNEKALDGFHNKIARLKFLDPACGCGNFLIITYRELRTLELEILRMKHSSQQLMVDIDFVDLLKVDVEQFYGIEYEGFPCQIAQVGMWLIDHQMNMRVSDEFGVYHARLPLTQSATIVHGNALRINWEDVVSKHELSYILGNPPFVGRRYRTPEQIEEVDMYFSYKDIDYVACWHKKSANLIQNTNIRCAFVSTNSITQGEQVSALWEELMTDLKITINFAHKTFKWSNEAKGKAAVYCVIVGFSTANKTDKQLSYFNEMGEIQCIIANNINGYLQDAPNVFIKSRSKPLCNAPIMKNGNVPLDGDALKIEDSDYSLFENCPYVKKLIGGRELLHNEKRYVLWLVGANPAEIKKMPHVIQRIEMCRQARLKAKDAGTKKLADTPMFFRDTNNPENYIALPMVSSERRKYIPMAYLDSDTIPTNQVQTIPNATLYHFGVLTSNVHMAWTRAVCGRLKSDYRYSKDIVYNNFPWAQADDKQKADIEKLAQAVLDARGMYPTSSLADLYDPLTMPPGLLKAHRTLDTAVMKLYGFPVKKDFTEADCVAALMEMYQKLTKEK